MTKEIKYDSYLYSPKKGDILVFEDGSKHIVNGVKSEHTVVIDDNLTRDLSIIGNQIKTIITEIKSEETPAKPIVYDKLIPDEDDDIDKILYAVGGKKTGNNKTVSYHELFEMMEKADTTELHFSKSFWHYTHSKNLQRIVESGLLRSRYNTEGTIPFDSKDHFETSKDVMRGNRSRLTERHVRFYLNPKNAAIWHFIENVTPEELRSFVAIGIRKEALSKSWNSTFLYYQNAKYATDDVYQKSHQLNNHYGNPFYVYNLDRFNFKETYSEYDPEQSKDRRLFQMAEFLVWKDLSIKFIDKIYFYSQKTLNEFLYKIKDTQAYNEIKGKCVYNRGYFFK